MKYQISINPLADFSKSTDSQKKSIVKQQKNPNPFKIAYYQLPKARIKKAMASKGDLKPVLDGIDELKKRVPTKKRQISDRIVSLEALQRFVSFRIPSLLKDYDYKILKGIERKSITINSVEINISPDLIIEIEINNQKYLGAVKTHISKQKKFDAKQQSIVATAIFKYLETEVVKNGEIVLPELCMSIDVFGSGIISAPDDIDEKVSEIEMICEEIKQVWDAA